MIQKSSSLLLDEDFHVEYVGEGAANVVFRLVRKTHGAGTSVAGSSASSSFNEGFEAGSCSRDSRDSVSASCSQQNVSASHIVGSAGPAGLGASPEGWHPLAELPLLRLRKDLSTVTSIIEAHQHYQRMVLPYLDKEDLVESSLATLPEEVVERCNAYLLDMEMSGVRPKKRRNAYLSLQPYANLVQDMSPQGDADTVIEFKLKWLAQSPSAPKGAYRCRTCALRAMRQEKKPEAVTENTFCPLDLADQNRTFIETVLTKQLRHAWSPERTDARIKSISTAVTDHLLASGLIEKIKGLQERMDPHGILRTRMNDEFLMAMTLRDCTLFIRVDADNRVEACLGDIDLKPPTKSSYWRLTEERLIEEGWYTCKERHGAPKDSICALSR